MKAWTSAVSGSISQLPALIPPSNITAMVRKFFVGGVCGVGECDDSLHLT